jgi:hypothetical protein
VSLALRILDADDQHVLGQPAFVARLPARDAQRVAFLAEQRIAAVAGAVALDGEILGEMHDETPFRVELAGRVQALDELSALARDPFQRSAAHARHDRHVDHDIRAVGDLDTAARVGRVDRPHAIGHDVQRASLHAPLEQPAHPGARLDRVHPVVVRPCVLLVPGADEGEVLDSGDIRGVRIGDVAAREGGLVELFELSGLFKRLLEARQLSRRSVAPLHPVGGGQLANLFNPIGNRRREAFEGGERVGRCGHYDSWIVCCPDETTEYSGEP